MSDTFRTDQLAQEIGNAMVKASKRSESELLEEAKEILVDKKAAGKQISMIIGETAKAQGIPRPQMSRVFNYLYYMGKGWVSDPLTLDPNAKETDKISPIFIKLKALIMDLVATGQLDKLNPYIDALGDGIDISITYDGALVQVKDVAEIEQAVRNASGFKKTVAALDEQLKEEKAQEAEDMSLVMKGDFAKVLSLYDKKTNDKDVDDAYQNTVTKCEMLETAFNKVYDESLN